MKKTTCPKVSVIQIVSVGISTIVVAGLIAVVLPVRTLRVGECPGSTVRLSVVNDGWKKLGQAEIQEIERKKAKEEFLKAHPGTAMGCVLGKTYKLYLF